MCEEPYLGDEAVSFIMSEIASGGKAPPSHTCPGGRCQGRHAHIQ